MADRDKIRAPLKGVGTSPAPSGRVREPGASCEAGGDDHQRREGLIVTVTSAVEVREEHDRVLIGDRRLRGLRS